MSDESLTVKASDIEPRKPTPVHVTLYPTTIMVVINTRPFEIERSPEGLLRFIVQLTHKHRLVSSKGKVLEITALVIHDVAKAVVKATGWKTGPVRELKK